MRLAVHTITTSASRIAGSSRVALHARPYPTVPRQVGQPLAHALTRSFTSTPLCNSAGLTNILASDDDQPRLSIKKQTWRGFHLTDDLLVPGGLILIEGTPFLWNVDPPNLQALTLPEFWRGWSADAFKAFEVMVPRPEILLFGTGESVVPPPKEIRDYISSLGIQLDVMSSRNAASTFNVLQEEGRRVAVALCPVKPIDPITGGPRTKAR